MSTKKKAKRDGACPECGQDCDFCPHCGKPIPKAPQPYNPWPYYPVYPKPYYPRPYYPGPTWTEPYRVTWGYTTTGTTSEPLTDDMMRLMTGEE